MYILVRRMNKDNFEDSSRFLKGKIKEIKRICKDKNLSNEEKGYLIEIISKKMEKELEKKFFKSIENSGESEQ